MCIRDSPKTATVSIVKTVSGTIPTSVGGTLSWDLVVTNTGNVTLSNLVVTDTKAVVTGSPVATLAPGVSVTLTASHILTQADVDAGSYSNQAVVTGKDPQGNDVTDNSGTTGTTDDPTVIPIPKTATVSIVKTVSGTIPTSVGGTLSWDLVVTNTGNVTLSNLVVTDTKADVTGSPIATLAPGVSVTLTASHILTQADVDAGTYINQASVIGQDPQDIDVTDDSGTSGTNDDPTIIDIIKTATVSIVKTVSGTIPTSVGGTLSWDLVVTNTGNVTLKNLVVTDTKADVTGSPIATLAPGASVTLTASHILTQADVDAGTYINQASVIGQDPQDIDVTDDSGTSGTNDDPTIIDIIKTATVSIVKTVSGTIPTSVGGTLSWDLVVTNTGNVTLKNLVVTDTKADVTGSPIATLAPGVSVTLTASHILTQADVDAGTYINQASVIGQDPQDIDVTDDSGTSGTNDDPTIIDIIKTATVSIVKTVSGTIPTSVGGTLSWDLVVTNTGNVTLKNLVVTDTKADVTGSPIATLAPGASVTLTASHILTQADVDAGTYINQASVIGQDPQDIDVTDDSGTSGTNDDPTIIVIIKTATVSIVKTVSGTIPTSVGGTLSWDLVVTNTGNVTLKNLVVTDTKADVTGSPIATLAPGVSVTLTASHILTQADVDAGTYINQASVIGQDPQDIDVTDNSGTTGTTDD